jgi:hypothetical protein
VFQLGTTGKLMNAFWKQQGKRPRGDPSHRWERNMKIYFIKLVYEAYDLIKLTQVKLYWRDFVISLMNSIYSGISSSYE